MARRKDTEPQARSAATKDDRIEADNQGDGVVEQKDAVKTQEGQDMIVVGHVYRQKNDGGRKVIPFYVDFASAQVQFAPVGRASEDRMRTSDFLNTYEHMGAPGDVGEEALKTD